MVAAKSVRIDPNIIKMSAGKAAAPMQARASFGDFMGIANAFAPLAAEAGYQATGSANAAAVLHSAFTALPTAYGSSQGGYMNSMVGNPPGILGAGSYSTPLDAYGVGAGGASGVGTGTSAIDQGQLIQQMNENNMDLLGLQALMQNNMQQWTTRSNVLKSVHDAKMAMIQHFAVRG